MSILVSLRALPRHFASAGVVCLLLVGCGASEPPPLGTLDPSSTTHPGITSTVSTATGGNLVVCEPEAPPTAYISDFSDWSGKNWGDTNGLYGEAFTYVGDNTEQWGYALDSAQGNMHVTGLVLDYAGFGMGFTPCIDATGFSGIQFDLWGTAGTTKFQVQTSEDQNKDYGDARATCDSAVSGECQIPYLQIADLPTTPTTLTFAWADFSGGNPVPTVSTNQLLGLQWQFECGGGDGCPVDIHIDNVTFH